VWLDSPALHVMNFLSGLAAGGLMYQLREKKGFVSVF
jgi:hypothetical protein